MQTIDKETNGRKKQKKTLLMRLWRFLQTTATEVIKGDSKNLQSKLFVNC